jgi:hypothetical protein
MVLMIMMTHTANRNGSHYVIRNVQCDLRIISDDEGAESDEEPKTMCR